jgi:hypothetical protein
MNNKINHKKILVPLLFCFTGIAYGMNLVNNLYDTLVLPEKCENSKYQFYALAQTGLKNKCFDECNCVSNVLRIWNTDQNSIKMLEGLDVDTQIGQLRTRLDANDDGVRGHFSVCGDLDVDLASEVGGWFYFNKEFFLSLELPIYSMKLKNVSWTDLTKDVSYDDARVKSYLTNNFAQNVKELGCLDICGWKRSGIGDLAVIFGWAGEFPQSKKILKNVKLGARTGLTLPTCKKADEDKIFAFSFGNDGATAAFFGAGLDLTFGSFTKAGLDVQMIYPFGNTRCRRIKTSPCQTDLLFLTKSECYKSMALTQRFNLYLEFYGRGFSFKPGYQFIGKGEDTLYICSNKYFDAIANTAESLQEWTMHSLVFDLSYHFCRDCSCGDSCVDSVCKDSGCTDAGCSCCSCKNCSSGKKKSASFDKCDCGRKIDPYIALFAKIPFNGTRAAMVSTIGLTLALDF